MQTQIKNVAGILATALGGAFFILAMISYTTYLFGMAVAGQNSGFTVTGGQNPYENITVFQPHILGPYFIVAALAFFALGVLLFLDARFSK